MMKPNPIPTMPFPSSPARSGPILSTKGFRVHVHRFSRSVIQFKARSLGFWGCRVLGIYQKPVQIRRGRKGRNGFVWVFTVERVGFAADVDGGVHGQAQDSARHGLRRRVPRDCERKMFREVHHKTRYEPEWQ